MVPLDVIAAGRDGCEQKLGEDRAAHGRQYTLASGPNECGCG